MEQLDVRFQDFNQKHTNFKKRAAPQSKLHLSETLSNGHMQLSVFWMIFGPDMFERWSPIVAIYLAAATVM